MAVGQGNRSSEMDMMEKLHMKIEDQGKSLAMLEFFIRQLMEGGISRGVLPQHAPSPDKLPGAFPIAKDILNHGTMDMSTNVNSHNTTHIDNRVNNAIDNSVRNQVENKITSSIIHQNVQIVVPLSVKEIETELVAHLEDMGLQKLAPGFMGIVQEVSAEAAKRIRMRKATSTEHQKEINDEEMSSAKLALYDTVVLCDDSGSMKTGKRIEYLEQALQRIVSITTEYHKVHRQGVVLRWLNCDKSSVSPNCLYTPSAVRDIIKDMRVMMRGPTKIGTSLKQKILDHFLYAKLDAKPMSLQKPILITIITDGDPFGEPRDELKKVILECKKRLASDEEYDLQRAVVFHIIQVGNSKKAKAYLTSLRKDKELKGILQCPEGTIDEAQERAGDGQMITNMNNLGQMSTDMKDAYEYWWKNQLLKAIELKPRESLRCEEKLKSVPATAPEAAPVTIDVVP